MFLDSIPPCWLLLCIQELASNTWYIQMLKIPWLFIPNLKNHVVSWIMEKEISSPNLTYLYYPPEFWHWDILQVLNASWVKSFYLLVFCSYPLCSQLAQFQQKNPDKSLRICLQRELFQNSYSWWIVLNWIPGWIFVFWNTHPLFQISLINCRTRLN